MIFNGNCLSVMGGMAGGSVDAIITDPPYGILNHRIETALNIESFLMECKRVVAPRGFIAFFGRQPTLSAWNTVAESIGLSFKTEIIWYKRQRSSPMGDIGRVHENISIWCNGSPRRFNRAHLPYTDLKQSLADLNGAEGLFRLIGHLLQPYRDRAHYDDAIRFIDTIERGECLHDFYRTPSGHRNEHVTFATARKVKPSNLSALECALFGLQPQSVVSFLPHNKIGYDSTGEGKGEFNIKHPTVKPVRLLEWLIQLMTKEGETVLDPFMGSGTTGLACQSAGREFIGIELDGEYFNIAKQRLNRGCAGEIKPVVALPLQQQMSFAI